MIRAVPFAPRIARTVAAIAVVVVSTIVAAPPARAASAADLESCFLSRINAARAGAGASSLSANGTLSSYGRAHSTKMADAGQLYHSSSAALEPNLPNDWRAWGENVGMSSDSSACDSLFEAFMGSSGHRANILDPSFDVAGIGVFIDPGGAMWTTHVFVDVASAAGTPTTTTSTPTTTTTTPPAPTTTVSTSTTTTAPPVTTTTPPTTPAGVTTSSPTTVTTSTMGDKGPAPSGTATPTATTTPVRSATTVAGSPATPPTGTAPAGPDATGDDGPDGGLVTAAVPRVAAGDCSGPTCNETLTLIGLLTLAGSLGGVIAYWALRP